LQSIALLTDVIDPMNPSLLFAQNGKPIFCTNKKMMKILIPVDFSISSTNAVHYASKLADKLHAEIVLLHVVFMEGPPMLPC
jgi:hypothetical protein